MRTQTEDIAILDEVLLRHAKALSAAVEQVGGTPHLPLDQESLRTSPLGKKLYALLAFLTNEEATLSDTQASQETLSDVLMQLYGRAYLTSEEDGTPFGELINAIRVKGAKMADVMNINEILLYLNETTGQPYYLPGVYHLVEAVPLWPLRLYRLGDKEIRRYERVAVVALAQRLKHKGQPEAREE